MTKKSLFSRLLLLIFVLLLSACSQSGQETITLHIIHTNDTHSQIEGQWRGDKEQGGAVERSQIIEMFRAQDPDLLYLDAGDMVQGSPYFNIYNGIIEMEAMNLQGLVAATLGNHEFDNGLPALDAMLSHAEFPILLCNYDCTGTVIEKYVRRSMVIERKGVRIGLTGVSVDPEGLIFTQHWEGIQYLDPATSATLVATELKEKDSCDVVIVLSHLGFYKNDSTMGDLQLATNSRNIDLIIGGHSHTNLEKGITAHNLDGRPVTITQTGGKAAPIGLVEISLTRESGSNRHATIDDIRCSKLRPEKYDLSAYGQTMRDFILPYKTRLDSMMNMVVNDCPETMTKGRPQSLLGNFTADALLAEGSRIYGHKMDLSIMNNGGLRSDIDSGQVTIGDLYKVYPFENTLCILEMKGKDVQDLMYSLAGQGLDALGGCQVTIQTIENRTRYKQALIEGKAIDPERIYYVATIDYLAEGNSGMSALTRAVKTSDMQITLRDMMIHYVKELRRQGVSVSSQIDDRVIVLDPIGPSPS